MASKNSSNNVKNDWELSLYELQRTPHEVITDNTEMAVPREAVNSELICSICLDLLNKTMATKCLHRFCFVCIVSSLRAGNKICPTCRTKLVSKRCLRPDTTFDSIISALYPNREEFNAHQNKMMESLNQSQSQNNMVKSLTEGLKQQKQKRSYNTKNKRLAEQTMSSSSNMSALVTSTQMDDNVTKSLMQTNGIKKKKMTELASTSVGSNIIEFNGASNGVSSNDMELVFKPHPKEMHYNNQTENNLNKTDLRYIKAPSVTTVEHLSSYLTIRLNLDHGKKLGSGHQNVRIYILQAADHYILLDNNLTLQSVKDKFWNDKKEKPMEIFYSYN